MWKCMFRFGIRHLLDISPPLRCMLFKSLPVFKPPPRPFPVTVPVSFCLHWVLRLHNIADLSPVKRLVMSPPQPPYSPSPWRLQQTHMDTWSTVRPHPCRHMWDTCDNKRKEETWSCGTARSRMRFFINVFNWRFCEVRTGFSYHLSFPPWLNVANCKDGHNGNDESVLKRPMT